MRTFKLVLKEDPGNDSKWVIEGLPDCDFDKKESPDTTLWLVGMYHSLDTPESVLLGVYGAIYDHHQTADGKYALQHGDVIESAEIRYERWKGQFVTVPPMRLVVNSYHIEMESPDYQTVNAEYKRQEKAKNGD